ncbi:TlpA family protein disulfide reductase [candidate division KSB1 bacterium]|nr:TlpA family protein disulfide reductase [candidate division KSB1 bacterium]
MKPAKLFLTILVFFVSMALFTSCNQENKSTENPEMNKSTNANAQSAYNFELVTLEGQKITLDDFKGKVLLLDFWDTWCPPCKAEIPHFVDLYTIYNEKGLEILGVAFGREGKDAVNNFIRDYNINYINALANQNIVYGFGGISGIPTTFLIDKNGKIYKKYVGYNDKSVFENDIKALL